MVRSRFVLIATIAIFCIGLSYLSFVSDEPYMLLSVGLVIVSMAPFLIRFEFKAVQTSELVLISVLAAIAAVARVPFAALPSVQPTSFFIIAAAIVFGAETGFLVGAFAALVSNMFLGQGPWTPWQMFAWGMMGWTAGAFGDALLARRWALLAFGAAWGFLFGAVMNVWIVAGLIPQGDWTGLLPVFAASLPFDLMHAASNVFFLALFTKSWTSALLRFRTKYGLLRRGRSERTNE